MNHPPFNTEIRMVPLSARAANETLAAIMATTAATTVRHPNNRIWRISLNQFRDTVAGIRRKQKPPPPVASRGALAGANNRFGIIGMMAKGYLVDRDHGIQAGRALAM